MSGKPCKEAVHVFAGETWTSFRISILQYRSMQIPPQCKSQPSWCIRAADLRAPDWITHGLIARRDDSLSLLASSTGAAGSQHFCESELCSWLVQMVATPVTGWLNTPSSLFPGIISVKCTYLCHWDVWKCYCCLRASLYCFSSL